MYNSRFLPQRVGSLMPTAATPRARTASKTKARAASKSSGRSSGRAKKEPVSNSREDLQAHIDAFLKAGGKVTQIPRGVSGQTTTSGRTQIVLNHRNT